MTSTLSPPTAPSATPPPSARTGRLRPRHGAANWITVDKTPAALWVDGLAVRLFGLSSWSLLVPQALMGVATVALLCAAVRRSGAGSDRSPTGGRGDAAAIARWVQQHYPATTVGGTTLHDLSGAAL